MKVLYLFTEYYPYGDESMSEHAFLKAEIRYLTKAFDRVIVVPSILPEPSPTKKSFEIDTSLANILHRASKISLVIKALINKYFYKEILSKNLFFRDLNQIKKLLVFAGKAKIAEQWLKQKQKIHLPNTLFYTFWNTAITLGISSIKETTVVSRAHGHDIYEKFHGYLPCYKFSLGNLHALYLASQTAVDYLAYKFPLLKGKLAKRHLGVKKALMQARYSDDQTIRIVSCSYFVKIKRIHLIVEGIREYLKKYDRKINWVHFGYGTEFEKIEKLAESINDSRFQFTLKGRVKNSYILRYYRENAVDLFITTTESEGGVPVSLQEAQAHGIPVIGTNVGGVPEIINNEVGVLMSKNPAAGGIADAIHYIVSDSTRFHEMRRNSFLNWEANFDADKNFQLFSVNLRGLLP